MGQVLHGSATTTEAIRRAIQRSEEGVRTLARKHGISATTVQKWRKRDTTADARMGPNLPDRTTPEEEAKIDALWAARGEPRIYLVHALDEWASRADEPHDQGSARPALPLRNP